MKSKKKSAPAKKKMAVEEIQQVPIEQVQQQAVQYPVQPVMQAPTQTVGNALGPPVQRRQQVGYYGGFGTNMHPPADLPGIFNDDEPLIEAKESVKEMGKESKVQMSILAQRSQVKLGEETVLPAMCSVLASGGERTSVDLICVMDVSGSMSGDKIQLVKDTMNFLLETLTPSDRLSLISFNNSGRRICGLKAVTPENMPMLNDSIKQLVAGGGTRIMSGMEIALKTIRDRKVPNKVTSVFLLSDGQDRGAEAQLQQALARKENEELGVFSIHSFGFGTDHDEDLMNKICEMKDGSFYFIKELDTLDEAFCNALGGIISLVASEVIIRLRLIAKDMLQGVRIGKVYGDKWVKEGEGEYSIKLTQLMSEVSKDFVFELLIPKIEGEVGDVGRENVVLEGILSAKGVQGQHMAGAASLSLTLINSHEQIAEINQNVEVIENYLRVKATEAIQENMKKAEASKYQEAQAGIDNMIQCIHGSKKARKDKMWHLVQDLEQIKEKCSAQSYQAEGRKWMVNAQNAHSKKGGYQYSNAIQEDMVMMQKAKKAKR